MAKSRLVDWKRYQDLCKDDESMAPAAKIYEAYEEEKRKRLLLDFHDLLMEAHRMLTEHDEWRDTCRRAYPHTLVDE